MKGCRAENNLCVVAGLQAHPSLTSGGQLQEQKRLTPKSLQQPTTPPPLLV